MHQGEIYQDFLKWGAIFRSFSYNNFIKTRVFQKKFVIWTHPPIHLDTKEYSIYNQWVLFAQLENLNKLWNNNSTVYENEQNQNKNKTKSRHNEIDHAFYCSI